MMPPRFHQSTCIGSDDLLAGKRTRKPVTYHKLLQSAERTLEFREVSQWEATTLGREPMIFQSQCSSEPPVNSTDLEFASFNALTS